MPRILVRSGKDPRIALSPEAALARNGWGVFGANIGNLLFQTAMYRAVSVPGTEVVSDSLLIELGKTDDAYIERVNSEYDAYVIPLANAFRGSYVTSLRRLTNVINKLAIPVVVAGIGAQFKPGQHIDSLSDEVNDAARNFVAAVLERSTSIGVRGEITKDYLQQLGFPGGSIDVIGCPSLYLYGADLHVDKRVPVLGADSRIAMNVTPSTVGAAPLIAEATASYPGLTYIPQEHHDLAMMMWGEEQLAVRRKDPRIPTHVDHPLYVGNRMRFFVDALPWVDYLRDQDFAFGTRLHGNVAALLAGTPAYVVAHDSRTLELARYHAIPHRSIADIDESTTVAELYDEADYTDFNRRHAEGFATYRAFLDRNALPHIFDRASDAGDGIDRDSDARGSDAGPLPFDAEMAAAAFPPAVEVAGAGDTAQASVYAKLRWLRQGPEADSSRTAGGYRPPFAPEHVLAAATGDPVTRLIAAVDRLTQEVATLRKRERSLKARIDTLEGARIRALTRRAVRKVRSRLGK